MKTKRAMLFVLLLSQFTYAMVHLEPFTGHLSQFIHLYKLWYLSKKTTLFDVCLLSRDYFQEISLERIQEIIHNGADVNECSENGTPLKFLVDYHGIKNPRKCSQVIRLLVQNKADIHHIVPDWYYSSYGLMPQHYYSLCWLLMNQNYYQLIEYLMDVPEIKEVLLNERYYFSMACRYGYKDIIKIFLKHGFDIDTFCNNNSCIKGFTKESHEIINILLQNGAPLRLEDTYRIEYFNNSFSEAVYFFQLITKKCDQINWFHKTFNNTFDVTTQCLFFERLHYLTNTGLLDIIYGEYEKKRPEKLLLLLEKADFWRKYFLKKKGYPLDKDDYQSKKQLTTFQLYDCWINCLN